ncbi:MAG: NAD(P)/FAD-dependent oxidoreductase [Microbacteriaceae bacterium]
MQTAHLRGHSVDLAIIGAGIVGTSIAVAAAQRGLSVAVIDANPTPGFGSTSASAGIVRVHAGDFASSLMSHESVFAWKNWRDFVGVPASEAAAEFVQCGTFILEDHNETLDKYAAVLEANGIGFSFLGHDTLQEELPWADLEKFGPPAHPDSEEFWKEPDGLIERALHTASSGYVADPALAAQNLAQKARRLGAHFVMGQRVVGASRGAGGNWQLTLQDGNVLESANVVNAAGPASIEVNRLLGVGNDFTVGQRIIRQELHHVTASEEIKNPAHIVDGDLGINFRPEGKDGFMVGSSGDPVDGEELISDSNKYRSDATRDGWYRQAGRAARRIPSLALTAIPKGVAGLYDVTDDWLPIFDKTDQPGVFIAIGTSGNQFKTAPVAGDFLVDLVVAQMNGVNTDEHPLEVHLKEAGQSIQTSVFSRLRTVNDGGMRG